MPPPSSPFTSDPTDYVSIQTDPPKPTHYTLSRRRWPLVGIFSFLTLTNAAIWLTFAPVAQDAAKFLQTSSVDYFSLAFLALTSVGMMPAAWLIQEVGILTVIIAAASLNCVGAWVRVIAVVYMLPGDGMVAVVMVGQLLAALAGCIIIATPVHLSAVWMGEDERGTSTSLAAYANILGIGTIYAVGPPVVQSDPANIPRFLLVIAVATTVSLLLFAFFRRAPDTPPSSASTVEKLQFLTSVRVLFSGKQRWLLVLLCAWGVATGAINTLVTVCNDIGAVSGFTEDQTGWLIVSMIGAGTLGAILAGVYIDKTRRYTQTLVAGFIAATICLFALAFVRAYVTTLILYIGLGLSAFTTVPTSLELSVELAFPSPEAFLGALMWTVGQLFAVFEVLAVSMVPGEWAMLVLASLCVPALMLVVVMNWVGMEYRRLGFESTD